MAKRSTKSGSSKSTPRPVTPRRQTAIDAYKESFQRDPPRSMSIKQMQSKADGHWRGIANLYNGGNRGLARDPAADRPYKSPADVRREVLESRLNNTPKTRWPTSVAGEYEMKFGYKAPADLSEGAMKRWIDGPQKFGPGRSGDPAYEGAVSRAQAANAQAKAGGATNAEMVRNLDASAMRVKRIETPHTNDSHYGITTGSDSKGLTPQAKTAVDFARTAFEREKSDYATRATAARSAESSSPRPGLRDRLPSGQTVNRALMGAGIADAAGRGFQEAKAEGKSTGEAVVAGAKSAAVPAAIAAAPAIAKGAAAVSRGAFGLAQVAAEGVGAFDFMTGMWAAKISGAAAITGVAAKGVEIAAKGVSRVALPAMAAYSAYQGAKEAGAKGENMTVGAGRGLVRAFDPSAIFMKRGVGERVFDAGVNAVSSRMSSGQQAKFAQANAHYSSSHMGADAGNDGYQVGAGKRGFGNPNNQAAAQKAKGNKYEGPAG